MKIIYKTRKESVLIEMPEKEVQCFTKVFEVYAKELIKETLKKVAEEQYTVSIKE